MDFAAARRTMVDSQLRPEAVTDPRVVAAMAVVPRELFLPAGQRASAYVDRVVPLGEGRGLSPPASLGRLLTLLAPRPGERALVVGSATGYAAAVLAEIGLAVTALESDAALAGQGPAHPGIRRISGALTEGAADGAPYDLILIDGEIEQLPEALIAQLAVGGRLGAALVEGGVARLVSGTRSAQGFGLKSHADAAMAPLPGFARPPVFTF